MGKSSLKKQQKTFQKTKLKVGKKLKRTNETKITVRSKKIALRQQFHVGNQLKTDENANETPTEKITKILDNLQSSRVDCRLFGLKLFTQELEKHKNSCSKPAVEVESAETDSPSSPPSAVVPLECLLCHIPSLLLKYLHECSADDNNFRSQIHIFLKKIHQLFAQTRSQETDVVWKLVYDQLCREAILIHLTSLHNHVKWEAVQLIQHLAKTVPSCFALGGCCADIVNSVQSIFSRSIDFFAAVCEKAGLTHENRILIVRTLQSLVAAMTTQQLASSLTASPLIVKKIVQLLTVLLKDGSDDVVQEVEWKEIKNLPTAPAWKSLLAQLQVILPQISLQKTKADLCVEFIQRQYGDSKTKKTSSAAAASNSVLLGLSTRTTNKKLLKSEKKKLKKAGKKVLTSK